MKAASMLLLCLCMKDLVNANRLIQHSVQSSHISVRDENTNIIKAEESAQKDLELGN